MTSAATVTDGPLRAPAAVFTAVGKPLEIRQLQVREPHSHEIRVRMAATGVCHTDQSIFSGAVPFPPPLVLGHEGAGVVESVGPDVMDLKADDHVVLTWLTQCGACFYCSNGQPELCTTKGPGEGADPRFTADGCAVGQLAGVGTFSSVVVVDAATAIKIPAGLPLTSACLIGCGVLTGIGAARNTARVAPGDAVAVVGCGGVGLNVIQGARLAGAAQIIAVDRKPEKLGLAQRFGATSTILSTEGSDLVASVRDITDGRGADITFEVVGSPAVAREALDITRPGGRMCVVGAAPLSATLEIPMYSALISQQKSVVGCRCGSANLREDVPFIVERYQRGDLLLDELVGDVVRLAQINEVLDNIDSALVARTLVCFD
jgi:Zn-dependent alcohol dehydrogenase